MVNPDKHKAVGDAKFWARRHRLKRPLDKRTSQRFAAEFEQAVRQRGAKAKAEADRRTNAKS